MSRCAVKFAFLRAYVEPQESDWKTGSWEARPLGGWAAEILLGGDTVLLRGTYAVWVGLIPPTGDTPERPRQVVGQITIN